MIKRQFVSRVAALSKLPADQVNAVLAAVQSIAAGELAETGEARLPGLVTMTVLPRSERAARNPKTGVPCMIAPGHTVKSRPVSTLTRLVVSHIANSPVQF